VESLVTRSRFLFSLRYLTGLEGMHGMVESGLGVALSIAIG
jgi:hypothetical protein